ncbi:MAG: DNRLRE domain-containing protein [Rhodocyclaceae bacterium]|nr:DNRLRE domain-containing protein [Rhodocyclaceae bacterium]
MAVLLAAAANAQARVSQVFPTDDATVSSAYPDTNWWNAGVLLAAYGGAGADVRHAYLKFALPPARPGEMIKNASLQVYSADPGRAFTHWVNLYHVGSDGWNEFALTWSTAPAHDAEIIASRQVRQSHRTDFLIPATVFAADSDGVLSLALGIADESGADKQLAFHSEESWSSPRLTVVYGPYAPIPEPETWATLAAGLGILGALRRRPRA